MTGTTSGSTFRIRVRVPKYVKIEGHSRDREEFFAWCWRELQKRGLLGIHEGTLLSEKAVEQGFQTDSWVVDSGEAPADRDWVGVQDTGEAELYFGERKQAESALKLLADKAGIEGGPVEEQKPEDWDAQWKASFTGARVPPFWHVIPAWDQETRAEGDEVLLRINPGAGFGTGTHETTQLCLQSLGECREQLRGARVLDFGSGSGILSVGAALLGAQVDAVEIDPLANENATENAQLNGVSERLRIGTVLFEDVSSYPVIVANILKPVLLHFSEQLTSRLQPGGLLVLSGLIQPDVEAVSSRYSALLGRPVTRVRKSGEWRALVWDSRPSAP